MFGLIEDLEELLDKVTTISAETLLVSIVAIVSWVSLGVYISLNEVASTEELMFCTLFTMAANAIAIAQIPIKWVLAALVLSTLNNLLLIV